MEVSRGSWIDKNSCCSIPFGIERAAGRPASSGGFLSHATAQTPSPWVTSFPANCNDRATVKDKTKLHVV